MSDMSKDSFLLSLPLVLQEDPSLSALAEAVAQVLAERAAETDAVRIYPVTGRLPEDLLDILAYDYKVDWWDAGYSLEEKRQLFQDSFRVHRTMGTKGAVETAISAIYPDTEVQEWFEYGGDPYHFKILINSIYEDVDPAKYASVMARVEIYKNFRSVLDEIEYYDRGGQVTAYAATAVTAVSISDGATAVRY